MIDGRCFIVLLARGACFRKPLFPSLLLSRVHLPAPAFLMNLIVCGRMVRELPRNLFDRAGGPKFTSSTQELGSASAGVPIVRAPVPHAACDASLVDGADGTCRNS